MLDISRLLSILVAGRLDPCHFVSPTTSCSGPLSVQGRVYLQSSRRSSSLINILLTDLLGLVSQSPVHFFIYLESFRAPGAAS